MRIAELLALRWRDLDLTGDPPTVHVCGTLVEPRQGHVEALTRQDETKTGRDRTLILPASVVEVLAARRKRTRWRRLDDPVFASGTGTWLWPKHAYPSASRGWTARPPHAPPHGRHPRSPRGRAGRGPGTARPLQPERHLPALRRRTPGRTDLRHLLSRFFAADDAPAVEQGETRS